MCYPLRHHLLGSPHDSFMPHSSTGSIPTVARRGLWDKLRDYGTSISQPWIVLGDFNTVMREEERYNMAPIGNYEMKDVIDCRNDLGLSDMNSTGCEFTFNRDNKFSKLDRALINGVWLQEGWYGNAHFRRPGPFSDHTPCIVSILDPPRPKNKPFKFLNMWTAHAEFGNIIADAWSRDIPGTAQFTLCRHLYSLKRPLRYLNAMNFSHISMRVKRAKEELDIAQQKLLDNPHLVHLHAKVTELDTLRSNDLIEAEMSYLRQLAKCEHLKLSDRCTKFFHAMVKSNSKRNFIAATEKRTAHDDPTSIDQVAEEFISHYKGLLGTGGGL
ncbi:hypothetical protein RND71_030103 [Anisodus tanguticus]|uniref:Endonuclease/exonuclease/phosphatase domain-containing protein n=1 Tax=Anisodus tanguticus TaxID=243964 RepID=A0AAE1RFS7_9SOLA|nr:hypothetical protein RND71_030103 [Anisodus tanguticus]